jgi:hypothetical protein
MRRSEVDPPAPPEPHSLTVALPANAIESGGRQLAPTFAFIDPFRFKGLPLGTDEWRAVIAITDPETRKDQLVNL